MPSVYLSVCCVVGVLVTSGRTDDAFKPLVKGTNLDQFEVVDLDASTMTIKDGEIRLTGKGNANGYFATKESYQNYVLDFEWMYELHAGKASDGNSGLMLHMDGPAKVWPKSIEIQIWYKEYGSFYTLNGGKFNPQQDDRAARNKALEPLGKWNRQEVTCKNGTIKVKLNGVEYAGGMGATPDRGRIGWMFEGSPIRFRNLKIKKL